MEQKYYQEDRTPELDAQANDAGADAEYDATIARLKEALMWLDEMAGYAESHLYAEWKQKNGSDYSSALSQARALLMELAAK